MHLGVSGSASQTQVGLPSREWEDLHRATFRYLWELADSNTGLVSDKDEIGSPASSAVTGMALSALAVGVEHGWVRRREAVERARTCLRFLTHEVFHHGGFCFHFMDKKTGERAWACEVSSVDSTLLFYGALVAATYFDGTTNEEREVRDLANQLFARADWNLWRQGEWGIRLAWKPERGFGRYFWTGYSEAVLVYLLALGSPSHPLPRSSYQRYVDSYSCLETYGQGWYYCGPLFTHLFPHLWLDLRRHDLGLWENTRAAIQIQQQYAARNPKGNAGYNESCWGISACDGPGEVKRRDRPRRYAYRARGVPFGPDDGTLSPPVALASLAFDPEAAQLAHDAFRDRFPELWTPHGLRGAVNPGLKWHCTPCFGLDQGMLCILLENARSGLFWEISRRCEVFETALKRAQG